MGKSHFLRKSSYLLEHDCGPRDFCCCYLYTGKNLHKHFHEIGGTSNIICFHRFNNVLLNRIHLQTDRINMQAALMFKMLTCSPHTNYNFAGEVKRFDKHEKINLKYCHIATCNTQCFTYHFLFCFSVRACMFSSSTETIKESKECRRTQSIN